MSRRVAILGGTKFFGMELSDQLVKAGYEVTVFSRIGKLPPLLEGRVKHVQVDMAAQESETPEVRLARIKGVVSDSKFEVVIDNISWLPGDVETYANAFSSTDFGQYILCSSVAVYNDWNKDVPATGWEGYELKEGEANLTKKGFSPDVPSTMFGGFYPLYADGKRAAERELIEFASAKSDKHYTILRPAVIEGVHDFHHRTWYWVQRLLDGKPILIPQTVPQTMYRHVFATDVAQAFVKAVDNPKALDQTMNIAGDEVLSASDYVMSIAHALSIDDEDVHLVDAKPVEAADRIKDFEFPPFFAGTGFVVDTTSAKLLLGFAPTPHGKWMSEVACTLRDLAKSLPDSLSYSSRAAEAEYGEELRPKPKSLVGQFH